MSFFKCLFNGYKVSILQDENSSGDNGRCLPNNVNDLMPQTVHLKMIKVVHFMCISPHFFFKRKEKQAVLQAVMRGREFREKKQHI